MPPTRLNVYPEAHPKIPRQPTGGLEKDQKPCAITFGLGAQGEILGSSPKEFPFFSLRDISWAARVPQVLAPPPFVRFLIVFRELFKKIGQKRQLFHEFWNKFCQNHSGAPNGLPSIPVALRRPHNLHPEAYSKILG